MYLHICIKYTGAHLPYVGLISKHYLRTSYTSSILLELNMLMGVVLVMKEGHHESLCQSNAVLTNCFIARDAFHAKVSWFLFL